MPSPLAKGGVSADGWLRTAMMPQPDYVNSLRTSGRFFGSLVALSIGLAFAAIYNGDWTAALELLPGTIFFTALAWSALSTPIPATGAEPGNAPGTSMAGKPVPVGPNPKHHLVAAQGLPPSEKTYLIPHD
jgi:hypothetical protein